MIELPETYVLAKQINETLVGKIIRRVTANASPHAFAWYSGDPGEYNSKLAGKKIISSNPGTGYTCGGNTEIYCEDMLLVISTPIKFHKEGEKLPAKHQLLLEFEDDTHMSCTIQMWGGMFCYKMNEENLPEGVVCNKSPTPFMDEFDETYFNNLFAKAKTDISAKAFLATEQRIPGFGNGVLHDVLFEAKIHPKRKLGTFSEDEKQKLFHSVKTTLSKMRDQGGRDTEKDLFGKPGGYKTILSKKTLTEPCYVCGRDIVRQAYLGGNIYFCPNCQPL